MQHLRTPSNLIRCTALIVIALGFWLRLRLLGSQSLWYDELLQLDIAQGPLNILIPRLRGHTGVPLDYLISHFWIMLGRDDAWVRVPAVVAGTLALPVAYQLGRVLLGRVEGLLLLTLLTFSPFHLRYSQEVRPYALVVLGVMLAVLAYWRLRQTGRWRYFGLLQLGVLIFTLSHIFAAVMFIPLLLFGVIDFVFSRSRKRALQTNGALLLTAIIPMLVFMSMGWADVLFFTSKEFGKALGQPDKIIEAGTSPVVIAPGKGGTGGPVVNWNFVKVSILEVFASGSMTAWLLVVYGLVGLGLLVLFAQKKVKLGLLLLLWLLIPPLLVVALLVFRQTFFRARYIITILPVYLLLLSVGLLALPRWLNKLGAQKAAIGALLVLSGFMVWGWGNGLTRYFTWPDKEHWHLVVDFIVRNAGPNDAIIAYRAEPTVNWYHPAAWAAPNYYENLEVIQQVAAQHERSWVILSIFSSGADAKVKAWLSEQQAVRFALDPIIHVYYLGVNASPDQLLEEIQSFALPPNHAIYASLARENRHRPAVARRYYQLAIELAPNAQIRDAYQTALDALP